MPTRVWVVVRHVPKAAAAAAATVAADVVVVQEVAKEEEEEKGNRKKLDDYVTNRPVNIMRRRCQPEKKISIKPCNSVNRTKFDEFGNCQPKKKVSKPCSVEGCINMALRKGVCWRHGAKELVNRKRCGFEGGCTNRAVKYGICWIHGAKEFKEQCGIEGCTNFAVRKGVCKRHGAQNEVRVRCSFEGCKNLSKTKSRGLCAHHDVL